MFAKPIYCDASAQRKQNILKREIDDRDKVNGHDCGEDSVFVYNLIDINIVIIANIFQLDLNNSSNEIRPLRDLFLAFFLTF